MEISVKWLSSNRLADVSFVDGNTSFRMSMLDAKDRAALSRTSASHFRPSRSRNQKNS